MKKSDILFFMVAKMSPIRDFSKSILCDRRSLNHKSILSLLHWELLASSENILKSFYAVEINRLMTYFKQKIIQKNTKKPFVDIYSAPYIHVHCKCFVCSFYRCMSVSQIHKQH